jgi:hypothetical protein
MENRDLDKSYLLELFYYVLRSGGGWNLLLHNVRDQLSNSRITQSQIQHMVIEAAKSSDIAHYMFVASATGCDRMFPRLIKTIILHNANNLGYYLTYVRGSRKLFQQELDILRKHLWTYNDKTPSPAYLRFLTKVIAHSTDAGLKKMMSNSRLDWKSNGDQTPSNLSLLVDVLCQDPRVTLDSLS